MPAMVRERKAALRAAMRDVRRAIASDPDQRARRSSDIWAGIVPLLSAHEPHRVLLFESLPTEPDTAGWIDWCRTAGIEVFTPEVDGSDIRVMPGDVDPLTLDLVVVPGLAFTADGGRLGQGGGHFDRFLRRLRPDCLTVGVAFSEQLVTDLPIEPHDVRLREVVTA